MSIFENNILIYTNYFTCKLKIIIVKQTNKIFLIFVKQYKGFGLINL